MTIKKIYGISVPRLITFYKTVGFNAFSKIRYFNNDKSLSIQKLNENYITGVDLKIKIKKFIDFKTRLNTTGNIKEINKNVKKKL